MHARLLSWSLRQRRARHLLNAVLMAVTVAVLILFVSVYRELVRVAHAAEGTELTRGLILPKLRRTGIPMALQPTLAAVDGVREVHRFRFFPGRHDSGITYGIWGEEEGSLERMQDIFPTDPAVIEAWKKDRPLGGIVTEALANKLGLEVGQQVEVPTAIGPLRFHLVGISTSAAIAHGIRVHFDLVKDQNNPGGTCNFRIYVAPPDFQRVAKGIKEATANSASPVVAITAASTFTQWAENAATVPAVLGFLGLFLMLTTAMTLANTAAIATRERRTETATLRVLGYYRRTIVTMLVGESMLVGLVGGLVGIAGTWALLRHGIQLTPGGNELAPITVGVPGMIAGAIAAVVIPAIGTLPSALVAARMPLVTALRDSA